MATTTQTPSPTSKSLPEYAQLLAATHENTAPLTFEDVDTAKVVKVIDGDTVTLVFPFGSPNPETGLRKLVRWNARVAHVDAPEIHSRSQYERAAAERSMQFVTKHVGGQIVHVNILTGSPKSPNSKQLVEDKFGRLLAEISYQDVNTAEFKRLDEQLLAAGLANPYEGKTKIKWKDPLVVTTAPTNVAADAPETDPVPAAASLPKAKRRQKRTQVATTSDIHADDIATTGAAAVNATDATDAVDVAHVTDGAELAAVEKPKNKRRKKN